jgi:hypothetical protein
MKLKYALSGIVALVAATAVGYPHLLRALEEKQRAAATAEAVARIEAALKSQDEAEKKAKAARHPGAALAALRMERNKIDNVDWYTSETQYNIGDRLAIYIGDSGTAPWLRLTVKRAGRPDMLGLQSITIADGKAKTNVPGTINVTIEADKMMESLDVPISGSATAAITLIADSGDGAIRLHGLNGTEDRDLTPREIKAIKSVIAAYRELGGH